jgi:membrane protease YdiL (CAAX protease family)
LTTLNSGESSYGQHEAAMADDANAKPEPPPLVLRVEPPAAPKPRPGFGEAVLWCILFMVVLLVSLIVVTGGVLTAYALGHGDPGQFLVEQLTGFATAFAPTKPGAPPRPPAPVEIGVALGYGMLASQFASFAFTLILIRKMVGLDWKRQLGVRQPAAMHVLIVVMMAPAFLILSEGVQELYLRLTGITPTAPEGMLKDLFSHIPWFVTFLAVSAGPGVVEELWCRGFLGRGLSSRYGLGVGVFLTSLLFALMHGDPSRVLLYTMMGAFLHFVYIASRSLWVSMLLHLLNNGIAVLFELSPMFNRAAHVFEEDKQGIRAVMELASLGVLVFGSVALWTSRPEVILAKPKEGEQQQDWQPDYPAISLPPTSVPAKLGYRQISPVAVILAMISFVILVVLLTKVARATPA